MTLDDLVRLGVMSAKEVRTVKLLRRIKAGDETANGYVPGRGHGTVRVEITDGTESLFKHEFSERPPPARV